MVLYAFSEKGFMFFFDIIDSLVPILKKGDINGCADYIERELGKREVTPFHAILNHSISNDPRSVAVYLNRILEKESERFIIAAAYTELNDFNINPDRWFCDTFAYDFDGGNRDYDWLADWKSERAPSYEITGLEPLQSIFASQSFEDSRFEESRILCEILIVIRFQKLIQTAVSEMNKYKFPLYVSAHDYDFIARFPIVGEH
jgi:hypothetical protein